MSGFLRQSTQVVKMVGPYLDKTNGVTEETGLAGAGTEISKEPGAAFGTGPTLGTHDAEGWYPITLTTTHTNTVGLLKLKGHDAATHLPVWEEWTVVEEAVYDALYAASAAGPNVVVPDAAGVAPTVAEIQAEMEENGASILDTLQDKFVGITLLNEWLGAIAGDQNADATALSEIRATGVGSGTYDPNNDSIEAIRDRGDAAWPTATGFNTTTPPTVGQIQTELEENGASLLDTIRDELANGSDGLTALKAAIDAIPTTAMRGTDSVVLSGPTKAEMDTAHGLLATESKQDTIDTVVDAVKVVTDKMVFTKANELDVNTKSINDAEVVGDGNATPWDGA